MIIQGEGKGGKEEEGRGGYRLNTPPFDFPTSLSEKTIKFEGNEKFSTCRLFLNLWWWWCHLISPFCLRFNP